MRIDLPTVKAYHDVVASCRSNIDNVLPRTVIRGDTSLPAVLGPAETKWAAAKKALDSIDASFDGIAERIQAILLEEGRVEGWKAQESAKAVASYSTAIAAAQAAVADNAGKTLDIARRAALPQRPGTPDAAQEARIAGIKADMQLLVSNTSDPKDFVDLLGDQLSEAVAVKDQLTVWVLAGSGWVNGPLIKSRHSDSIQNRAAYMWDDKVATLLATGKDDDLTKCVRAYRTVADPQNGIPALLVTTGGFLASIVRKLAEMDPYSWATNSAKDRWR